MKLFQQLLVAPAALGLLAPVAATAGELNLDGVNKYASEEQVTSISQFSDVKPTDWAYQALSNLIERYGCVAGYPNGTYRGGKAMTRFEAAALLNACLDRVSEVTDELKKLMAEFEKELAILKGRVDGLEAKVGVLEAQQFSTTTKLKGYAAMVLGGVSYGGNTAAQQAAGNVGPLTNGMSFNYDLRLDFDTSFTGSDLLRTRLRAGNFGANSAFGGGTVPGTILETAFQELNSNGGAGSPNIVEINRLFYQFPIGSEFTATFGARVRQDDMLAMWPSVYPADSVLDFFTYAGSPQTYNLNLGGGAGLWWQKNGFSISANYVSGNAGSGTPDPAVAGAGGIGNTASQGSFTSQIGYAGNNWGAAFAYTYAQNTPGAAFLGTSTLGSINGLNAGGASSSNNLALSAYWQPSQSGWIPSISAGWGIGTTNYLNGAGGGGSAGGAVNQITVASWSVGLQWMDAFVKGNAAGMAFGGMPYVTQATGPAVAGGANDGNWAWEWWYKFQVTDNISVTPAIFYLSRPLGNVTVPGTNFNAFGALVKTTFKF